MFIGNSGSARIAVRFSPPELPKYPLLPADDRFWFYYNQLGSPFSPDSRDQGPDHSVSVSYHRFLRLASINNELLSERENPDHCLPVEPNEDEWIEGLYSQHHEQDLHIESMERTNSKIQYNQLRWGFRGARELGPTNRQPAMIPNQGNQDVSAIIRKRVGRHRQVICSFLPGCFLSIKERIARMLFNCRDRLKRDAQRSIPIADGCSAILASDKLFLPFPSRI